MPRSTKAKTVRVKVPERRVIWRWLFEQIANCVSPVWGACRGSSSAAVTVILPAMDEPVQYRMGAISTARTAAT